MKNAATWHLTLATAPAAGPDVDEWRLLPRDPRQALAALGCDVAAAPREAS